MKKLIFVLTLFSILRCGCVELYATTPSIVDIDTLSSDIKLEKEKMLWFDASANFKLFSKKKNITLYLERAKEVGFNKIVVDIKPLSGDVLYESDFLTPATTLARTTIAPRDWDYLQFFIDEAKRRDLKVSVSTTIFPMGSPAFKLGEVYRNDRWKGMTCIQYTPDGMVDIKDDPTQVGAFLNPIFPEVQEHALRFIREVVTKYDFDAIAFDYCRFPDEQSDFSDASRVAFESFIGESVESWPQDIFTYAADDSRVPGKYYKQWWEFRAKIISDFITLARKEIKAIKADVKIEYWAASWLHAIYGKGQNWGSKRATFSDEHLDSWATPTYKQTGFAAQLDTFITGTYLTTVWGANDPESIEFGLARSVRDVDGDCALYGSLYALNHLDEFEDAVYLCLTHTEGLMVFDIVQVIENNLWDSIRRGIDRAEKELK